MRRYKTPEEFLEGAEYWQEGMTELRRIMLESGLKEEMKWGAPAYTFQGKNLVGIGGFKSYFGLWFFQGALLKDEAGKLVNAQEGVTHAMRQWRMQNKNDIDRDLILAYVMEAVDHQKSGRGIKPKKKQSVVIPEELKKAFKENKSIRSSFQRLSPYKQKEYAEYVGSAKRVETRQRRLEKVLPMIAEGKGLNDKYR